MAERFLLREEPCGGLIIDRDKGLELMLNHTGFFVARLALQDGLPREGIAAAVQREYSVPADVDLAHEVNAILLDVQRYFETESGQLTEWESGYRPAGDPVLLSSPVSVFWEVTAACNLRCMHCYNASGEPASSELDTAERHRLLDEMARAGVSTLIIGGGEPFLRQDFMEVLEHADELGFIKVIATNGTLLTPRACERLARFSRLRVYVSLHHFRADQHDAFCGVEGTFERVRQATGLLGSMGIPFGFQSMITKHNRDELRAFRDFVCGTKARSWHLKTAVQLGRELVNQACLADPEVLPLDGEIEQLARECGDILRIHFGLPLRATRNADYVRCPPRNVALACGPGYRNCGLLPDGRMVPCSFLRAEEWRSEHSVRQAPFLQLWAESRIFEPFRSLNSRDLPACNTCSLLGSGCNGGCRARAYNEAGSFYARDPRCTLRVGHAAARGQPR